MSGAGDWRYVDVVHRLAGKLEALEWVRQVYGVPVEVSGTASQLGAEWGEEGGGAASCACCVNSVRAPPGLMSAVR
jgi:hypothetical protein